MSACIVSLLRVGWEPVNPDMWIMPCETGDSEIAIGTFRDAAADQLWCNVTKGTTTEGVAQGEPCFDAAKTVYRSLLRKRETIQAKALAAVVCHKCWLADRLA